MVGCSILGCNSRSERKIEGITFHSYPQEQNLRLTWIAATGRNNWQPTKYSKMCSLHFDDKFIVIKNKIKRLDRNAVPVKNIHVTSIAPIHFEQDHSTPLTSVHPTLPVYNDSAPKSSKRKIVPEISPKSTRTRTDASVLDTPRKRKMRLQMLRLKQSARSTNKKLRAVRQSLRRLGKKVATLENVLSDLKCKLMMQNEQLDILDTVGGTNRDFLKRLLGVDKRKYSEPLRKFALCLHFLSPKAYDFVRKQFQTCLPHPKTLSKWYCCIECEPGFNKESFDALKKIVTQAERDVVCALSLDEMSIRQHLQWNGKQNIGYVNVGDNLEGDNLPLAKDALLFMLNCINGHWKLPIGYFFTNGVNGEQRSALLKTCILLVIETGVIIASVTFDGCPANFSMARLLGASLDNPDSIDPEIKIGDKPCFIFPDPCHMIKLVRNTLGDKKELIDGSGNLVSWRYIENLNYIQNYEGLHLANKLRTCHINYRKQVMKVKLATQTFSRSVADSISFCDKELNLLEFKESDATVKFINNFNNLFDIMNSRRLTAAGLKKPISRSNWEEIKLQMSSMFDYICELKFVSGERVIDSNRKTGFLGFLICIKSLFSFFKEYIDGDKPVLAYIPTFKMSQDHLELFFSAIRSKGGFNNNPTAAQFQSAYKRLLIHGELKNINTGNCTILDDVNILKITAPVAKINDTRSRLLNIDEGLDNSDVHFVDFPEGHDYLVENISEFSFEVIKYVAGFVVTKMAKIIKCDDCLIALLAKDKFLGLIAHKDRGGLHYPSSDVIKICEVAERVLRQNIKINDITFLAKEKSMAIMVVTILKHFRGKNIFDILMDHVKEQNPLENHIILLIKAISYKFLEVRFHHMNKMKNQQGDRIRNFHTKLVLFKGQ